MRDGVLYRQLLMRKPPNNGVGYIIDLAEITVPGGVIRVDRCRMAFEHELTLGHFGLPHVDGAEGRRRNSLRTEKERFSPRPSPADKSRSLPITAGTACRARVHRGFNAEADESTVLVRVSQTHGQESRDGIDDLRDAAQDGRQRLDNG